MAKQLTYADAGLNLEKYAETMAGIQPLLSRTWDATRVMPPPFPARSMFSADSPGQNPNLSSAGIAIDSGPMPGS